MPSFRSTRPSSAVRPSTFLTTLVIVLAALEVASAQIRIDPAPTFRRGDSNVDAVVNLSDGIGVLSCLFLGTECTRCPDAADVDDDGVVDLTDSISLFNWLFLGGVEPVAPGPVLCGPDRSGDRLGPCEYELDGCGAVFVDARTADAVSRVHYAARAVSTNLVEREYERGDPRDPFIRTPLREEPYSPGPIAPAWNSADGRAILLSRLGHAGRDFAWERVRDPVSIEGQIALATDQICVEPRFYSGGEALTWDDFPGGPITIKSPDLAFGTRAAAQDFLRRVRAEMPFFLPFTDAAVALGHGWFYNSGGQHRGQDYSRTDVEAGDDPTFAVRAVADGEVVYRTYRPGGGNIVVVEHTAPGGQKVLSMYMHLRDGRTNDIRAARRITSSSDGCQKYRAFARNFPDHVSWGTDEHTILVEVGDTVRAHEQIGWAGNTGCGGASAGLKGAGEIEEGELEGQPTSFTGNVHLHTYWAVPHPTQQDTWVYVDPYGVYDQVSTGCYDLLKDTEFARLIAPFFPTFHGIPYEVFQYYFGYYVSMGMKPRTLHFHRRGAQPLVSGSFQWGIPGDWRYEFLRTFDDYGDEIVQQFGRGFIPRETTTVRAFNGPILYSGILRELRPQERVDYLGRMTPARYVQLWQNRVVDQGWRIEDYFGYQEGGLERIVALATSHEGRPFLFYRNRTSQEMQSIIDGDEHEGLILDSFSVAELPGGDRFNAIFRPIRSRLPQCWRVHWGINPLQYQTIASQNFAEGFRLHKIQAYDDSNSYAALFYRQSRDGCQ